MTLELPQIYVSKIIRAIVEFRLIEAGDRVLIGLSGGKDSLLLTYALALMRERLAAGFSLEAFTLDCGWGELDTGALARFCDGLGVPFATESTDIAGIIAAEKRHSPCYTCAYFRRAAINRHAAEHGCNKVAYAHHLDDAIETFMLSLFESGQPGTFLPATRLSRSGLTVIRPLVYLGEAECAAAVRYHGQAPLKSPCPYAGRTARARMKARLREWHAQAPELRSRLAAALRVCNLGQLWPPPKSKAEMREDYFRTVGS